MNEVMKNILTRRSVRAFSDRPVERDVLDDIVKAALCAPSAMNRQTWKFTVVTNGKKIKELADAIGEELGREGYDLYRPTVLIIPSNDRNTVWGREDNACALENIFLAAHSHGVDPSGLINFRESATGPMCAVCWISWNPGPACGLWNGVFGIPGPACDG